jgi:hypothetical protein
MGRLDLGMMDCSEWGCLKSRNADARVTGMGMGESQVGDAANTGIGRSGE